MISVGFSCSFEEFQVTLCAFQMFQVPVQVLNGTLFSAFGWFQVFG